MSDKTLSIQAEAAFSGFDLSIDQTLPFVGVTAIFGPSGSGKTTLLRMIAGFERPRTGRIVVDRAVWFDSQSNINIPAHKRAAGCMFQDARLFPHLSVEKNLRFADQRSTTVNARHTYDDIVNRFALKPLVGRRASSLSGGERQRVALARTLLTRPSLLLLDEPLAALDQRRKSEILPFLDELSKTYEIPVLYVSHDIDEVCRLADSILVLTKGRVSAFGRANDIVNAHGFDPVAGKFEASALIEGAVASHDQRLRLTRLRIGDDFISLPMTRPLPVGRTVRLLIRARDVAIATTRPVDISIRNVVKGTIAKIEEDQNSAYADVEIKVAAGMLRSRLTRAAVEDLQLSRGLDVYALIKSAAFDHGD